MTLVIETFILLARGRSFNLKEKERALESSHPQLDLNSTEPLSSFQSESEQGPAPLQILITRPHELDACPFWVSLYKAGPSTPKNLFAIPSIEGIFRTLTEEGLSEKQPLMLSENSEGKTPRQFYLVPDALCQKNPERVRELVVSTLEALSPVKAGLYFAGQRDMSFVIHMIEEISLGLSFLRTKELHFFTGEIGVSPLLNAALRVKARLEGRREVFVYH